MCLHGWPPPQCPFTKWALALQNAKTITETTKYNHRLPFLKVYFHENPWGEVTLCYIAALWTGTLILWCTATPSTGTLVFWYTATPITSTLNLWYTTTPITGTLVLWYNAALITCTLVLWDTEKLVHWKGWGLSTNSVRLKGGLNLQSLKSIPVNPAEEGMLSNFPLWLLSCTQTFAWVFGHELKQKVDERTARGVEFKLGRVLGKRVPLCLHPHYHCFSDLSCLQISGLDLNLRTSDLNPDLIPLCYIVDCFKCPYTTALDQIRPWDNFRNTWYFNIIHTDEPKHYGHPHVTFVKMVCVRVWGVIDGKLTFGTWSWHAKCKDKDLNDWKAKSFRPDNWFRICPKWKGLCGAQAQL